MKWWLDSTTVRGALVAGVPVIIMLLKAFGVSAGEEELGKVVDALTALVGAAGVVYAIIGRFKTGGEAVSFGKAGTVTNEGEKRAG